MNDYIENIDDDYQDVDDIQQTTPSQDLIVYSRDWTVATILDQIAQGNIDLNPGFQRRNAWTDQKRSKLIESILVGYPIPEIVLAEKKGERNSFIVIDGKQRLLTIAGFKNPSIYKYWTKNTPKTSGLKSKYNGLSYNSIASDISLSREFENSALRCTIISNYSTDESLYDIFYRLNAGSTPLSSQELRQALNKGYFSDFLIQVTDEDNVLRRVMGLKGPDKRLRDIEVLLRCLVFLEYAPDYKGNLLQFLDSKTKCFNERWENEEQYIYNLKDKVFDTITKLISVFGSEDSVARKYKNGVQVSQFNRVILEVLVFFFSKIDRELLTEERNKIFLDSYKDLFINDSEFQASIDGSTKNLENYRIRYSRIYDLCKHAYEITLVQIPFGYVETRTGR